MIRATLVLRSNNGFKKHTADIAAKAVSRDDLGTPAAKPAASAAPEESMMPWDGWFSSFLKDKLGDDRFKRLREIVLYRPDNYMGFEQVPRPDTKLPIAKDDPSRVHQFRQPSPGSQAAARMAESDASMGNAAHADDPYDVSYYKRDTGRRYTVEHGAGPRDLERIRLELLPQDDPRVKEAKEEFEKGPGSSPGNKGRFALAQTHYDPTGLRASMSTSFKATEDNLDANMPDHVSSSSILPPSFLFVPSFHPSSTPRHDVNDHRLLIDVIRKHSKLPTPVWMKKQEEIVAWYEERDLPVPIGGTGFGVAPTHARIARW